MLTAMIIGSMVLFSYPYSLVTTDPLNIFLITYFLIILILSIFLSGVTDIQHIKKNITTTAIPVATSL